MLPSPSPAPTPLTPPTPPKSRFSVTFAPPSRRVKLIISCSPSHSATIAWEPRIAVTDHLRHPELGGAFSAAVKKEIRAIFSHCAFMSKGATECVI